MIPVARRRHNVYLSPELHLPFPGGHEYSEAANIFLGDRFCYGTAYPFTPLLPYYETFEDMGLKEELVNKVLYENIAKVLKFVMSVRRSGCWHGGCREHSIHITYHPQ
jgi:uncharacterized protein